MTSSDQRALDTFIALADTLVEDFDITDFLGLLTDRCVELLDVTAAGLLLVDHQGTLNLVAASSEQARLMAMFQLRNQEGPGLECFTDGHPVRCPDLTGAGARWPRFAPAATNAGFAAVHALPMRLRADIIGGLTLFATAPGILDNSAVRLGQALANMATIGILHQRTIRRRETVVAQLQTALDSRILIEQAKGVLSERLRITVTEAFTLLRGHARRSGRRLAELSATVIDGTADVTALTSAVNTRGPAKPS